MLQHSNPASIILLILFIGPVLYFIRKASQGVMPKVEEFQVLMQLMMQWEEL